MPTDSNGNELQKGDIVMVPCEVVAVFPMEGYCNISLMTTQSMYPGNYRTNLNVNSKQTIKESKGD